MKINYCETVFKNQNGNHDNLHCETHGFLPANHLALNGDDWVCEVHATLVGCNCCQKNRLKENQTLKQNAKEFVFDKLIKADNRAEALIIEEVKKILGITEE